MAVAYHSTQITPDSTKPAALSVFHDSPLPAGSKQSPRRTPTSPQQHTSFPLSWGFIPASLGPWLAESWNAWESLLKGHISLPSHLLGGELTFLVGSYRLRELWENSLCRWSRSSPFPSLSAHRCRRFPLLSRAGGCTNTVWSISLLCFLGWDGWQGKKGLSTRISCLDTFHLKSWTL